MSQNNRMDIQFSERVEALIDEQITNWALATTNYEGLKLVKTRSLFFGEDVEVKVQVNPERIRSSAAKVDAGSIQARPCFLCQKNLPAAQRGVLFEDAYQVLVNPFPIFPRHLTIPHQTHVPQRIKGRVGDMMRLARALPDYVIFYNGPRCGASAPDHFHFQAGNKGFLPIEQAFQGGQQTTLVESHLVRICTMDNYLRKTLVLEGNNAGEMERWFNRVFDFLAGLQPKEEEPMLNILCSWVEDRWQLFVFPRKEHRPRQFYATGEEQILLSPASVDFGGVLITPRHEDYLKLNNQIVEDLFDQVTLGNKDWSQLINRFSQSKKPIT